MNPHWLVSILLLLQISSIVLGVNVDKESGFQMVAAIGYAIATTFATFFSICFAINSSENPYRKYRPLMFAGVIFVAWVILLSGFLPKTIWAPLLYIGSVMATLGMPVAIVYLIRKYFKEKNHASE